MSNENYHKKHILMVKISNLLLYFVWEFINKLNGIYLINENEKRNEIILIYLDGIFLNREILMNTLKILVQKLFLKIFYGKMIIKQLILLTIFYIFYKSYVKIS